MTNTDLILAGFVASVMCIAVIARFGIERLSRAQRHRQAGALGLAAISATLLAVLVSYSLITTVTTVS